MYLASTLCSWWFSYINNENRKRNWTWTKPTFAEIKLLITTKKLQHNKNETITISLGKVKEGNLT